jgi:hypothetical protein
MADDRISDHFLFFLLFQQLERLASKKVGCFWLITRICTSTHLHFLTGRDGSNFFAFHLGKTKQIPIRLLGLF